MFKDNSFFIFCNLRPQFQTSIFKGWFYRQKHGQNNFIVFCYWLPKWTIWFPDHPKTGFFVQVLDVLSLIFKPWLEYQTTAQLWAWLIRYSDPHYDIYPQQSTYVGLNHIYAPICRIQICPVLVTTYSKSKTCWNIRPIKSSSIILLRYGYL